MRLYISSGRHLITDVSGRVSRIEEEMPGMQAIFDESRESAEPLARRCSAWFTAPLILPWILLWIGLWRFASTFLSSDKQIIAEIQTRHEIPFHPVDKPLAKILRDNWKSWTTAHWGAVAFPTLIVLLSNSWVVFLIGISLIVLTSLSLSAAFLGGTIEERNWHIIREIADISKVNEYESGCLITGGSHRRGLIEMAERVEGIEVIDLRPPNPG